MDLKYSIIKRMDKTYTKGMLKLRGDVRKLRNRARNKERALNAELIKRRTINKDMQTRKRWNVSLFSTI